MKEQLNMKHYKSKHQKKNERVGIVTTLMDFSWALAVLMETLGRIVIDNDGMIGLLQVYDSHKQQDLKKI